MDTDSTRPRPDGEDPGAGAPTPDDVCTCGCSRAFELGHEHHDWLVGFEARGVAGVVDVIRYLDVDADSDATPGLLRWADFNQFVAMHAWEHPSDVYDLAQFVTRAIRARVDAGQRMLAGHDAQLDDRYDVRLPKASIDFHGEPTDDALAVAASLPVNVRRRIAEAVEVARRIARDVKHAVREWEYIETTLDVLLDDGTHPEMGDVLVAVEHAAGLGLVHDVLLGVAEMAQQGLGGQGNDGHVAIAKAVAHRDMLAESQVLGEGETP